MEFKPGDRVVPKYDTTPNPLQGTVKSLHDNISGVEWDGSPGEVGAQYNSNLRKIDLPKPGTKFRVKAGCGAAYRAGDKTAAAFDTRGGPIIWTFSRILPPEHPYAGQYELDGPAGKSWLIVGPRWLERIEEENVPSPPVAGKGVHARPLVGGGAKTQQSPAENPRARRNKMSQTLKIESQILVNGVPLKDLDVLGQIQYQEAEIARLEKIAHKPASLEADLDARKAALEQLIKLVNAADAAAKAAEPVTRAEFEAATKK